MSDITGLIGVILSGVTVVIAAAAAWWAKASAEAARDTVAPMERLAAAMEQTVDEQRQVVQATAALAEAQRLAQATSPLEARLRSLQRIREAVTLMRHLDHEASTLQSPQWHAFVVARAQLLGALAGLPGDELPNCNSTAGIRWGDNAFPGTASSADTEVNNAIFRTQELLRGLRSGGGPAKEA